MAMKAAGYSSVVEHVLCMYEAVLQEKKNPRVFIAFALSPVAGLQQKEEQEWEEGTIPTRVPFPTTKPATPVGTLKLGFIRCVLEGQNRKGQSIGKKEPHFLLLVISAVRFEPPNKKKSSPDFLSLSCLCSLLTLQVHPTQSICALLDASSRLEGVDPKPFWGVTGKIREDPNGST